MGFKEVATFILSTSILVGCGVSHGEVIQNEATPTLTPNPNLNEATPTLTPTLSQNTIPVAIAEDNLHLGTPGAIRTQMVSTAEAADLEKPDNEFLSSRAVDSLVSIALVTDQGPVVASGNLAYLFGYPVILTSGHVYGRVDEGANVYEISVKRLNIPNPVALSFSKHKEAHIYNPDGDQKDIGVIVITDPDEIQYLIDTFGVEQMLTINDLRFDTIEVGEAVTGICYPSATYPNPYPFSGNVYQMWESQVIIDGALTGRRCSGGGLFDSSGRYFASVSGGYSFGQFGGVSQDHWDDTYVFPLSSIGKDGLELLINQAVNE